MLQPTTPSSPEAGSQLIQQNMQKHFYSYYLACTGPYTYTGLKLRHRLEGSYRRILWATSRSALILQVIKRFKFPIGLKSHSTALPWTVRQQCKTNRLIKVMKSHGITCTGLGNFLIGSAPRNQPKKTPGRQRQTTTTTQQSSSRALTICLLLDNCWLVFWLTRLDGIASGLPFVCDRWYSDLKSH